MRYQWLLTVAVEMHLKIHKTSNPDFAELVLKCCILNKVYTGKMCGNICKCFKKQKSNLIHLITGYYSLLMKQTMTELTYF